MARPRQKNLWRGVYLSDIEMRICWMAILRIPPRGMATILKRSKAAISLARARLYEKLNGEKGNGQMFDEFIRELQLKIYLL